MNFVQVFAEDGVTIPTYATEGSACFDIRYHGSEPIGIPMGAIRMIPTGLYFDIPEGYVMKLYGRSGLALRGVSLANGVGVIDSDYKEELKVLLRFDGDEVNDNGWIIMPGDRIAQAEIAPVTQWNLVQVGEKPARVTDRAGGFGSTGRS